MTIPLRPPRGRRGRPHAADHLVPYRWKPGQGGGGQGTVSVITTLATMIRRTSGEGAELATFYFAVLRGDPIPVLGRPRPLVPTLDQRMSADAWLADRRWGCATEPIELAGEPCPRSAWRRAGA